MSDVTRLLRLLRPMTGQVVVATILGILTIGSGVGLMGTAAFLIATAALQPSIAELQVAIVGVRFFGLSRGVFRYLERLGSHQLTLRLLGRLRVWFYEALEPLAPARTLEMRSADLLTRAAADVESLQNFYIRVLSPPLVAGVVGVGTTLFLARYHPSLAAAFLTLFAIAAIASPLTMTRLGARTGRRLISLRADLAVAIMDGLQGMPELLAYGAAATHQRRVEGLSEQLVANRERAARIEALGTASMTLAVYGSVWIILVLAIPMVRAGRFDGVGLAVISLVVMAAFEAVAPLPFAAQNLSEQLAAAARIFAILDAKPAVDEPDRPVPAPAAAPPPALEIRALDFTYPGSTAPALTGLTLDVPTGTRLAVVGPSGAGKSTLVHLLLRFWDPTRGEIRLGGHPLTDYRLDDLRRTVGALSQRTSLFSGSLRGNISLARPHATSRELDEAAHRAGLSETIHRLPDGWETWIGDRGHQLSGGERQRVAIARLFLVDPPLLVLDEPTTGLDPVSEQGLRRSLGGLVQGRTTILITHRLAGMDEMDRIVVLDRGRVAESGTHSQLVVGDGLYRLLYEAQRVGFDQI